MQKICAIGPTGPWGESLYHFSIVPNGMTTLAEKPWINRLQWWCPIRVPIVSTAIRIYEKRHPMLPTSVTFIRIYHIASRQSRWWSPIFINCIDIDKISTDSRVVFIRPFEKRDVLCRGNVRPSVRLSVRLSVRPSVRPRFPDFSSTCFEISIWNLVYTFSRWHDMSSLSCITIGSLWPSLQPKVGQTYFLQSWPHK